MLAKSGVDVKVSLPSDREIRFTCTFQRSRQLLFDAWTQPEHLRAWWGCEGSKITRCEIDLRIGGAWRLEMQMADGSRHPFHGQYQQIDPGKLLVYTECYEMPQFGNPEWLTTVSFDELEEGTRLTHTLLHKSRLVRDGHLQAGMEAGSIQTMQQLDSYVGTHLAN